MKRAALLTIALLGLAGWVHAETLSIVQITDMQGQVGYEVQTREEFAALLKEIKEETAAFGPAAAECKKDWDANKDNKLPFQGNRIKVRSAKKLGADFTDREKADKKLSQIEERASDKQIEELAKEEKKNKQAKPKEEDIAKEEARVKAFNDAFAMISKKMADKLGRPVPGFGFAVADEKKEEPKKDDKKKEEPKKEEKKPAH
jgi:hypothetical protein